jgi:hypothetical protein
MKKLMVILAVILSYLALPWPIYAALPSLSLWDKNIVLADSDVEQVCATKEGIFALVNYQGHWIYLSQDHGITWQKTGNQLPETGNKIVAMQVLGTETTVLAFATSTAVFLSRDAGKSFANEAAPDGLQSRGEEITSLALSGSVSAPVIAVGVWKPQGGFPQEAVYTWGLGGIQAWRPQGMRQTLTGGGYPADAISVIFSPDQAIILVAIGDPDGSGPLTEGTYLNTCFPRADASFENSAKWSSPKEVSQDLGQSPKQAEMNSVKLIYLSDSFGGRAYVAYNTSTHLKDDVYLVSFLSGSYAADSVKRLQIQSVTSPVSIDSLDYAISQSALVVGVTTPDGVSVLTYLSNNWSGSANLKSPGTQRCQVLATSDGGIFAGTSGPASFFGRLDGNILVPISLLDASGGITQVILSPAFPSDRSIFTAVGQNNILKVKLSSNDFSFLEAQRLVFMPQGFDRLKIQAFGSQMIFFARTGNNYMFSKDGNIWRKTDRNSNGMAMLNGQLWSGGSDGILSSVNDFGFATFGGDFTSGFGSVSGLQEGPPGTLIVGGGSIQGAADNAALFDGKSTSLLPPLANNQSATQLIWAPYDNLIYGAANNQLYRLTGNTWERIDFGRTINEFSITQKGIYILSQANIYFAQFPIIPNSQWQIIGKDLLLGNWSGLEAMTINDKANLLIFWDSQKLTAYSHQISGTIQPPKATIMPGPIEPIGKSSLPVPPIIQPTPTGKRINPRPTDEELYLIIIPVVLLAIIVIKIGLLARKRLMRKQ